MFGFPSHSDFDALREFAVAVNNVIAYLREKDVFQAQINALSAEVEDLSARLAESRGTLKGSVDTQPQQ